MSDPTIWREHGTPLLSPTAAGPLDGVGVAVKDLFAVGGFRIGAGNPRWLSQAAVQTSDAWAVGALRAAGASIVGIAQTDELAFSLSGTNVHYGTPPNPAAPELITAGSSSGPAAAVATGQADVGLGTDTGGSVRAPASVCGLYGLRPTHGVIPVDGVLALAPSFDTVGWLAADAELLHRVGAVLLPPAEAPLPRRLLCPHTGGGDVRGLADALGADLVHGDVPGLEDRDHLLATFRTVQTAEAWRQHGRWIEANPGALGADIEERFRMGSAVDADAWQRAANGIAARRAKTLAALGSDAWLVLPATAGPGHRRDAGESDRHAWRQASMRLTVVASAFGLPSCVVPQGCTPPTGWALIGPPGADRALLDAALLTAKARMRS